jgi:peptide/nickel transport system substrate-binding protein
MIRWATIPLAVLVIAGCGGSSSGGPASSAGPPRIGGNVTVLEAAGGVDSLDPGYWYYQTDYTDLGQTTQRTLYGFGPTATSPAPDLATALPAISNAGKTLTIHLKPNIHYSPPLASEVVKSADIKYAIERCFTAQVGNGYAFAYYSDIAGAPSAPVNKVPNLSGIQTPNATTLVINTKVPVGVLSEGDALSLYCTTPVPEAYAAMYDSGAQSTYGNHEVFTGPYMIEGAGTGTIPSSSYQSGKVLLLVRNPSWSRPTDSIRHAYFNTITFKGGNDITVASDQILGGHGLMSGDWAAPPPAILKEGLTTSLRSQFQIGPSGGVRYIGLNTTIPPLNNIDVRKAIVAVVNRNALRLTRGGPAIGTVATHFIPPGMNGFQQAGGDRGPGYDFYAATGGNLALAESYMKQAGYPSGKYTGPPLLAVADNTPPASNTALAIESQLAEVGIRLQLREVPHATMYSKFCLVPKAKVAICPSLSWGWDFPDAQSMIDPVFNGKNIVPTGNTNVPQANDPTLNAEMNKAELVTGASARAAAWAKIDDQVTAQAYVVSWLWDNEVGYTSKDIHGVQWAFNGNAWDLTNSYYDARA